VAFAWNSPDRNLILGLALVLPLVIVAGTGLYLRKLWNEEFLHHSRSQLNEDWSVLNSAMKEKPLNPQE
jgi:predicted metal-dependent phosphotriesterase family hydrolase